MSRPQEVSLARLLHIYEARAAGAGVGGTGGVSSAVANKTARPPSQRWDGAGNVDRGIGAASTSDPNYLRAAAATTTTHRGDSNKVGDDDDSDPYAVVVDSDPDAWRRGPKAHQHLEAMRTLLAEVRSHSDANVADAYAKRVDRVEAMLEPYKKPAFCMASSQVEWTPYTKPVVPLRQRRGGDRGGGRSSAGNAKGRGTSVKISEEGQAAMARQRDLQEGLTDEMAQLASGLKANSLAMEASLKESRRELDEAEGNLERNLGGVKTAVGRQSAIYKLNASG